MPNHVTNKIIFAADKADEVFSAVCPGGKFDFGTLVPSPPNLYHGDLSSIDETDFPLNWNSWNRENWGTKWNCYEQSCGIENGMAYIQFDTAWSAPYPIMAAFCNRFKIPFEHRYFDEGHNFWGIDVWARDSHDPDRIVRAHKYFNDEDDFDALCIELKEYDPADVDAA